MAEQVLAGRDGERGPDGQHSSARGRHSPAWERHEPNPGGARVGSVREPGGKEQGRGHRRGQSSRPPRGEPGAAAAPLASAVGTVPPAGVQPEPPPTRPARGVRPPGGSCAPRFALGFARGPPRTNAINNIHPYTPNDRHRAFLSPNVPTFSLSWKETDPFIMLERSQETLPETREIAWSTLQQDGAARVHFKC